MQAPGAAALLLLLPVLVTALRLLLLLSLPLALLLLQARVQLNGVQGSEVVWEGGQQELVGRPLRIVPAEQAGCQDGTGPRMLHQKQTIGVTPPAPAHVATLRCASRTARPVMTHFPRKLW